MNGEETRAEQAQTVKDSNAVTVALMAAGTVVTLGVFGGAVALSLAGRDVTTIVGLIGPVAAAATLMVATLGQLVSLNRKQDAQSGKLKQVADQTNGALRAHIDRSVRAALAEHLGPPPTRKPGNPT